ncbi:LacI family DNA-binding transcriptional regulator [Leucobacter sp. USHLN154]|uniref:LacI family DNA-binding transcriptional regulator n=1 Tax=Leucobacter sp. USHLN154 TaxID=3081269 RepID=UPI0030188CB7
MSSPTIFDLAKALGLSKSTVAAALNGTGRTSEQTRERVRAMALEKGYVANTNARRLRTRTGGMIGLYVPADIREMDFYLGFAFGAVEAASRHGYDLAIVTTAPEDPTGWLGYGGVIVIDVVHDDPIAHSLLQSGVPVVAAGHLDQRLSRQVAAEIAIDHEQGIMRVLDALALRGVRHPALIGASLRDEKSWSSRVLEGYLKWMEGHRLQPVARTLPPFADNDQVLSAVHEIVAHDGIDGIVFGWQDAAERAQLILANSEERHRDLKIGTYLSRNRARSVSRFDAALDLEPHRFGFETANTLVEIVVRGMAKNATIDFIPTLS